MSLTPLGVFHTRLSLASPEAPILELLYLGLLVLFLIDLTRQLRRLRAAGA
jgi:hypothetical protein